MGTVTEKNEAEAFLNGPARLAQGGQDAEAFLTGEDGESPKELNVSGQPKPRYEWWGVNQNRGYLVKEPGTGDFRRYKNGDPRGITRATTFNKKASDQTALTAWHKRNVIVGACLRPDLLLGAHGRPVTDTALNGIAEKLEEAAGAKVAAAIGTALHGYAENLDGGAITLDDVPPAYRDTLKLYRETLAKHGLVPVADNLIERTVMVRDFGGVVGTYDRIFYHESTGTYLMGDMKSGKTLKYGMDEIQCQVALYARGLNADGVYDWNTDTWEEPMCALGYESPERLLVREDIGVVVHLPVDGPQAGTCQVLHADLNEGWEYAQLCYDVMRKRANKPKPRPFDPSALSG